MWIYRLVSKMGNCFGLGNSSTTDPIFLPEDADDNCRHLALGQNQPLIHESVPWESDVPLTEGQLLGKRDTFWETAPAYEGRREIWDALRAAAEAAEEEDYDLAQAILTGANISLPIGRLTDVYDELGNRYIIPQYCLSRPTNMASKDQSRVTPGADLTQQAVGDPVVLKIRVSSLRKDARLTVSSTDSIRIVKQKLHEAHGVEPSKVTMLFSGRVLNNQITVSELKIPKGHVIQAIVS